MEPYYDRIPGPHGIVAEKDRNPILFDWIKACGRRWACRRTPTGTPRRSATAPGSSTSATTPRPACAPRRASMYLHPIMGRGRTCRSRPSRGRCASRPRAGAPPRVTCCATAAPATASRRGARSSSPAARSTRRGCCCSPASGPRDDLERLGIDVRARPAGRRREPDRPPRVDHHLEAQEADGPRGCDGRRLRAVRQPPRRRRPARPDVPHLPAAVHVQHGAARATRCRTTAGASA